MKVSHHLKFTQYFKILTLNRGGRCIFRKCREGHGPPSPTTPPPPSSILLMILFLDHKLLKLKD